MQVLARAQLPSFGHVFLSYRILLALTAFPCSTRPSILSGNRREVSLQQLKFRRTWHEVYVMDLLR